MNYDYIVSNKKIIYIYFFEEKNIEQFIIKYWSHFSQGFLHLKLFFF